VARERSEAVARQVAALDEVGLLREGVLVKPLAGQQQLVAGDSAAGHRS
jgi:hypothetical protein